MSEKNAYNLFRQYVLQPGDRIDRIENAAGIGCPDVNYCINGVEGWIELKAPREPKRSLTPLFGSNHKLSQDQKNWFKRQIRAGGQCWLLLRTTHWWLLLDGAYAEVLNGLAIHDLISRAAYAQRRSQMTEHSWRTLRTHLATQCKHDTIRLG